MKKLFLLDAMALIFRAYYALIRVARLTSKGKNTNAQLGFTNTLVELMTSQKPSHMAVCFDTWAPTERHTDFAAYKANRQETPEDLLNSIPDIKRIIQGFNIPTVELDGYEADDVIGTLSIQAADVGYEVFMVTPDKDFGQLVTDRVKIYKPGYQGGDAEILGPAEVCAKWDIASVDMVVDMLALMGDSVDNIPGIAGVGQKTAAKLLSEYGSLDNILENADKIKGSLGDKIRGGRESALLSRKLATIITNVPVTFHEENFRLKEWNKEQLRIAFEELEFKSIIKRILVDGNAPAVVTITQKDLFSDTTTTNGTNSENGPDGDNAADRGGPAQPAARNIHNTPHRYSAVSGNTEIEKLVSALGQQTEICLNTITDGTDANDTTLVGISFSFAGGEGYFVPLPENEEGAKEILSRFSEVFGNEKITWVGQNLKHDTLVLKWYGSEIKGPVFDTMLAYYVMAPDGKRGIDWLSANFLGYEPIHMDDLAPKKGRTQPAMRDIDPEKLKDYAAEEVDVTLQLKKAFEPKLRDKEVERVFYEVENPLVNVLMEMEYEGVRVDVGFLQEYSKQLETEVRQVEDNIIRQAGTRFNIASPRQLGEVLFEKLQLDPKAKKTKTGQYATGEDVLLKLSQSSTIVADILTFRELTKLKSTYVDTLPLLINRKTGRVHTTYGQTVAVTGRLASINPNLQNIPVRTDRGREIRKAFIPRDDRHVLMSADYSQIELRIVAAMSGDKEMCDAFQKNKDIHTATAAKVYSIEEIAVTKEMRYKAKSVNFGIIYGQGAFGLADNLGISRSEAKTIIDNYKKEFAGIQKYMDSMINFAREHGYVQTLIGRKRWLRDIKSNNFTVRSFAERNAINSPIQGTAADMIKMAMIKVHREMKRRKLKSKMLLQVHDELVFDALKEEVDELKELIIDCMQTAMPLPCDVPVIADAGVGVNWLEAH